MRPYHRKLRPEPMRILVRHADAGGHRRPTADDRRPLTPFGRAQARRLTALLGGLPILRVLSSPSVRCRQTVVPLAREVGVDVEPRVELALDAEPVNLLRLLRDPGTENAVLCAHRETITAVLALGVGPGRRVDGVADMAPAAAWACYGDPDRPALLRYLGSASDVAHPLLENGAA